MEWLKSAVFCFSEVRKPSPVPFSATARTPYIVLRKALMT